MSPDSSPEKTIARALDSAGSSSEPVYEMVVRALKKRHAGGGTFIDLGCGRGALRPFVAPSIDHYIGADVIRHAGFPGDATFIEIDLDKGQAGLPAASADVVAAAETIEHLENPRLFFREIKRLVKPGGLILVTTPNNLSLISLLTLLTKNQFNAFQERPGLYPAHITALLEIDLRRIAQECEFTEIQIDYSDCGRMPGTSRSWPKSPLFRGRLFSDNILLSAIKPRAAFRPSGEA